MKTKLALAALLAWMPLVATHARADSPPVLHEVTDRLLPSGALNVLTYSAPSAIAVRDLGLNSVGLKAAPLIMVADEIRIFANRDAISASPKARIWLNSREGGRWWYQTGGTGDAESHVIQPGEMVLLVTRASTNEIAWTNVFKSE